MSDDKGFLARWSRRKRGVAPATLERPTGERADERGASDVSATSPPPGEIRPCVDPARLPPIDSIDAKSDVRAFLAPGVPADLMRAALRRAWSADPAIRDFIGLSENAWDFNAPGGVPGFGPVDAEGVRRLLAMVAGEPAAGNPVDPAAETLSADQSATPARDPAQNQSSQDRDAGVDDRDPQQRTEVNVAVQHNPPDDEYCAPAPRRDDGGALPE